MAWYLIMFDETVGDDLADGESERFLNEHMVEANSPRQAIGKILDATVDLSVVPSKQTRPYGCSIIELGTVKPKVKRINYVIEDDDVSIV